MGQMTSDPRFLQREAPFSEMGEMSEHEEAGSVALGHPGDCRAPFLWML